MSRRRRKRPGPTRVESSRLRAEASTAQGSRSLAQAAAVAASKTKPIRPWRFWVPAILSVLVAFTGLQMYGGTGVEELRAVPLATLLLAAGALGWAASRARSVISSRAMTWFGGTVGAVAVLLIVGGVNSVVIDGQVRPAVSTDAQVARAAHRYADDLAAIAGYDTLLRLDSSRARARMGDMASGSTELIEMAADYRQQAAGDLPAAELQLVAEEIAVAAEFGARALEGRRDLLLQYDARLDANVTSWHIAYTESVLTAGPMLADAAATHGVLLVDPQRDPVE